MAFQGQGVSGLFRTVVQQVGWIFSLAGNRFTDSPPSPVTDEMPELQDYEHVVAPVESNPSRTAELGKVQLNRQLCKRLEKKLAKARRYLQHQDAAATSMPADKKQQALQELGFVVKRGDDLIHECLCEKTPWLHVAVTMADVNQDVLEIELDLSWWTKILNILPADSDGTDTSNEDDDDDVAKAVEEQKVLYNKLTDKRGSLSQAARDDMELLKSKLEEVKAKHSEPQDEYYLSLYLLSRLNNNKGDYTSEEDVVLDQHFHRLIPTDHVGRGGHGEVWQVKWLQRFECARKEFVDYGGGADEKLANKEGDILKFCNHPHIVKCIWFWENENEMKRKTSYILMELMPEDLLRHIRSRTLVKSGPPFELHVAIDIMLQIAKAMRYLHGKKITHRDLKPSNILVRPPKGGCGSYLQVKLTDFGISKHYNGTQTSSTQTPKMGTPIYAAPEVFFERVNENISAAPKFPPRADVWSFAMTFSEILTGRSPFHGERRFELHKRMLSEGIRPDLPEDLPAYLSSCIASCWSPFPDKRPDFPTICRMLNHAKALSLKILHPKLPCSTSRFDAGSTVNGETTTLSELAFLCPLMLCHWS